MMKPTMKHKQTNPYGCGLYAVANACNIDNFITEERLEISKKGNNIGQLSKWLQDDGLPYYIEVLFYDHLGSKLPDSALDYVPTGDSVEFLPILLNVRYARDGKNHLIGGKLDKKGFVYLYDSLKEDMQVATLRQINMMYEQVYGLFILSGLDNEAGYVFI